MAIASVIPGDRPGFEATRIFRGATYRIKVERASPGNTTSVTIDGQLMEGNLIALPDGGRTEVHVTAVLT